VEGRLLLDGVVGEHFAEQLGVGVSGAASEQECLVAEPLGFVAMSSAVIESRSSRSGQRRGDARDRRNLSVRTKWSIPIHLGLAPVVSVNMFDALGSTLRE
jgi:hypothetical protein